MGEFQADCQHHLLENIIACLEKFGDAGYRSRYLSHAKRALYHLSYTPLKTLSDTVTHSRSLENLI